MIAPAPTARVLIVDDSEASRTTIQLALRDEGHELHFADSGASGLALAASIVPDLLVLDVMMPGMDGFEVCRRVRQDPHLRHIPVALVTAMADSKAMACGVEAGADDFLAKPFNKWELRARMSTLIRLGVQQRSLADRDRLHWMSEHAEDGFVLLDGGLQMIHANPSARRMLGLELGAPIGGDFRAQATRGAEPYPIEAWTRWEESATGDAPLFLVRDVRGTLRREWVEVMPYRDEHDPAAMTVVRLRDVTEQIERQMQQFEFHELVSHKLRTPLNGVVGAVDLLARDVAAFSTRHQRLFELLRTSTDRLHEAIVDVLEFVDGGATRERPLCVRSLEDLLHATGSEQRIADVRVSVDPDVATAHLALGEIAMRTVIREVLENARRFHPTQTPTVSVTIERHHADQVRISLADDGVHLSPRQLAHVLEPYVQGDLECTGQVPGMGMGLALVSTRLRCVGGDCRIENRADRPGIRVHLLVPRVDVP